MVLRTFLRIIKEMFKCKRGDITGGYIPADVPTVDGTTLQNILDVISIKDSGVSSAKIASGTISLEKVDSAVGLSTSSTSEVELDSVTLPAGTFEVGDTILIIVHNATDSANAGEIKIRIADGTNTHNSGSIGAGTNAIEVCFLDFLHQSPVVNTTLAQNILQLTSGTVSNSNAKSTMIANWIVAELTISLRGFCAISGNSHYEWAIYKISGS